MFTAAKFSGVFQGTIFKAVAIDISFFLYKNIFFPAEAKYSCISVDFRLKIFLWIFLDYNVYHISTKSAYMTFPFSNVFGVGNFGTSLKA